MKKRTFRQKNDIFDHNLMNLSVFERRFELFSVRKYLGALLLAVLLGGFSLPATAQPLQCFTASGVPPLAAGIQRYPGWQKTDAAIAAVTEF
jgi:hypothetical protein